MTRNVGSIYQDFPKDRYLASGRDSLAYKFPERDVVVKFYVNGYWPNNPMAFADLSRYREITNHASEAAIVENWRVDAGNLKNLPLRVNPYFDLMWCDRYRCIVGTCPLVKGLSVGGYEVAKKAGFDKFDKNVRLNDFRREIDRKLRSAIKFKGIDTDLINVMFVRSQATPYLTVVITDLCVDISELQVP